MGPEKGLKGIPGYKKNVGRHGKKTFSFVCSNTAGGCDFSDKNTPLPLHVIDEDIYSSTPTLLLGTVDKFAMLPFRPSAQGLFGY